MILLTLLKVCVTYYNNKNLSFSKVAISVSIKFSRCYLLLLTFRVYFKPQDKLKCT